MKGFSLFIKMIIFNSRGMTFGLFLILYTSGLYINSIMAKFTNRYLNVPKASLFTTKLT